MQLIDIDTVAHAPHPQNVNSVRRLVGEALGTAALDITYFELAPGEQFSGAYHRHLDREEVFVVLSGTATFSTATGDRQLTSGDAIHFAPGEWQLGRNDGADRVVAVLFASPKELGRVEARLWCPHCERETVARVQPSPQESGEQTTDTRQCLRCEAVLEG